MVIFTVLLASVTLPALATVYPYTLDSFLINTETFDNGDVTFTYKFNVPYYLLVYGNGVVYFDEKVTNNAIRGFPATGLDVLNFHCWPLGYRYEYGVPVDYGVLDISDFREQSTMQVTFEADLAYSYTFYSEAPGPGYLTLDSNVLFYFYDANGTFMRAVSKGTAFRITLPELADGQTQYDSVTALDVPYELTLIDGASYVVPVFQCKVTLPGHDCGVQLEHLSLNPTLFCIRANYNVLKENSATLKAVDKKLEQTNDLLGSVNDELSDANEALGNIHEQNETIINGTDEQQQDYEDFRGQQQDVDESLQSSIEKLQEYQKFDTGTVFGAINDFLEADGWKDIRYLLVPILEWPHTATMMLFILAFATLRTLLLGR